MTDFGLNITRSELADLDVGTIAITGGLFCGWVGGKAIDYAVR